MNLGARSLLTCLLTAGLGAQDPAPKANAPAPAAAPAQAVPVQAVPVQAAPAPAPPPAPAASAATPPPAEAPDTAHRADLTALRTDLEAALARQQALGEAQARRLQELAAALEEARKAIPDLAPLAESVKAGQEQIKALQQQRTARLQARLEAEQAAYPAALKRMEDLQVDLVLLDPLPGLATRLAALQQAAAIQANPEFQPLLALLKDKLAKGALGEPLKDPAATASLLANPYGASAWTLSGCIQAGGWSDKTPNYARAVAAIDVATRMDADLKAALQRADCLRLEVAASLSDLAEARVAAQRLVDPAVASPVAMASEAFKGSTDAFFKALLAPAPKEEALRGTLGALAEVRSEARVRLLERRFLVNRMSAFTQNLAATFGPFAKEGPCKGMPALAELMASLARAQDKLKAALADPAFAARELAAPETAGLF
jgi:hypothetical protein